jgi:hypothetical protein
MRTRIRCVQSLNVFHAKNSRMPTLEGGHPRQDYWTVTVKVAWDVADGDVDVPVTVTV